MYLGFSQFLFRWYTLVLMALQKMSLQLLLMEGLGAATRCRFLLVSLLVSTLSPVTVNSAAQKGLCSANFNQGADSANHSMYSPNYFPLRRIVFPELRNMIRLHKRPSLC